MFLDCLITLPTKSAGFISIDCGSKEESYVYSGNGLTYTSDSNLMKSGEVKAVPSSYVVDGYEKYLWHLRTFPKGKRNCYTLQPVNPGSKYLVRATFLYGNFDGLNSFPQFDLYLESTFVQTVNSSVSTSWSYEFIVQARRSYLTLCLCKTTERDPFISVIELRPMPDAIYPVVNATLALNMQSRKNYGTRDSTVRSVLMSISFSHMRMSASELYGFASRYPDDALDRFWFSSKTPTLDSLSTTLSVSSTSSEYAPPSVVMETAAVSSNASSGMISSSNIQQDDYLFMCIHFAELKKLEPNETREFNITLDSKLLRNDYRPLYQAATTVCSDGIYTSQNNVVEYTPTERSTLSPILNAKEVYSVVQLSDSATNDGDECKNGRTASGFKFFALAHSTSVILPALCAGSSLVDIRDRYQITKAWTGDPCLPLNYTWEGLVCSNDTLSPRVISLDLSNSGLSGEIPSSLANLSAIVTFLQDFKFFSGENPLVHSGGAEDKAIGCQAFTYSEVVKVTNNFKQKIGEGGFGPVYAGRLHGQDVAVKILSHRSKQGSKEFYTEVALLSRVHHRNLVSFIGYCDEAEKMILIYEYLPRGNLHQALSGKKFMDLDLPEFDLNWSQRLQIALNAAQGLEYLHSGCKPAIIHRDVKSTNILLNDKFDAKIADFGLSKSGMPDGVSHVSTAVAGTPGYLDPEYSSTCRLNEKSDVYSFGVVLLELISGKLHVMDEPSAQKIHIVEWVKPNLFRGNHANIADPRLCGSYDVDSLWRVVDLALQCTRDKGINRPNMSCVVAELKEAIMLCGARSIQHEPEECNSSYSSNSAPMVPLSPTTRLSPLLPSVVCETSFLIRSSGEDGNSADIDLRMLVVGNRSTPYLSGLRAVLSISGNKELCSSGVCDVPPGPKPKPSKGIVIGVSVSAGLLFLMVASATIVIKTKKRNPPRGNPSSDCSEEAILEMSPGRCQAFTFKEIEKITDNFRQKIGKGGFGPVYLGRLKGQKVAVKVSSDESKQGFKEFNNEVELLSRAHHKHVVSFLGYCHDAKRMILIYEYLSRGSLEDALSGKARVNLDWNQRLQIALDAAQGLDYLHSGCKPAIIHRDVKSANILLNDKLEAKIADFGLSKPVASEGVTHVTTAIRGTPGYWDPEYCGTCCLNEKSDVYSFGIVLLELVSGKRHLIDVPSGEKINIAHWVRQSVLEGKHANIADPTLCGRYEVDSLRRVVDLALHCTSDKGINRPKMCDVVTELKEAIRLCGGKQIQQESGKGSSSHNTDSDSAFIVPR
ncbi:probable LRR receptor-like serine/threonine-protein kinase PAM74 [Nymphaea colorata]|nr:probable LRR receptor-like serine/threonine-protein kinase PAM74 [Nymphaea colorata]